MQVKTCREWVVVSDVLGIFQKGFLEQGDFPSYHFSSGNFPMIMLGLLTRCSLLLGGMAERCD